jgi:hypothetical protein
LLEGAVRAVVVKVRHVLGQHCREMPVVEDQDPVQQFTADGADPSFGDGVGPRRQLHLIPTIGTVVCG